MFLKFIIVVTLSLFVLILPNKYQPNDKNIDRVTKLMGGASNARQEILV